MGPGGIAILCTVQSGVFVREGKEPSMRRDALEYSLIFALDLFSFQGE